MEAFVEATQKQATVSNIMNKLPSTTRKQRNITMKLVSVADKDQLELAQLAGLW